MPRVTQHHDIVPEGRYMNLHGSVRTELELRLVVPGGPPLPVRADLRYGADDPWAVRLAFHVGDGGDTGSVVEWLFARDLLVEGITGPAGAGDVRVWPSAGWDRVVNMAMASPSGSAVFELDLDALVEFLEQTCLAVPTGSEEGVVDLDSELALLFQID